MELSLAMIYHNYTFPYIMVSTVTVKGIPIPTMMIKITLFRLKYRDFWQFIIEHTMYNTWYILVHW